MTNSGCEHLHGTLTRVNVSPLRRVEQGTLTNRLRAPGLMLDTQSSQRFGSIDTRIDEIENNWIRMYVIMFLLWTKIKVRFDKNFYRCHKSRETNLQYFLQLSTEIEILQSLHFVISTCCFSNIPLERVIINQSSKWLKRIDIDDPGRQRISITFSNNTNYHLPTKRNNKMDATEELRNDDCNVFVAR